MRHPLRLRPPNLSPSATDVKPLAPPAHQALPADPHHDYSWVGALLVGDLIAAPIAAWIVKSLPPRVLGLSVGALIIVTNLQTIGDTAGVDQDILSAISVAFGIAWIAAMATLLIRARRSGARAAPVAA